MKDKKSGIQYSTFENKKGWPALKYKVLLAGVLLQ